MGVKTWKKCASNYFLITICVQGKVWSTYILCTCYCKLTMTKCFFSFWQPELNLDCRFSSSCQTILHFHHILDSHLHLKREHSILFTYKHTGTRTYTRSYPQTLKLASWLPIALKPTQSDKLEHVWWSWLVGEICLSALRFSSLQQEAGVWAGTHKNGEGMGTHSNSQNFTHHWMEKWKTNLHRFPVKDFCSMITRNKCQWISMHLSMSKWSELTVLRRKTWIRKLGHVLKKKMRNQNWWLSIYFASLNLTKNWQKCLNWQFKVRVRKLLKEDLVKFYEI